MKLNKQTIEATFRSNRIAMFSCIEHGNADRAAHFARITWRFAILLDNCMRELASRGLVRKGWPGLEAYLPPEKEAE
jgi:hypothetical protein